jgi:hypothetical protein
VGAGGRRGFHRWIVLGCGLPAPAASGRASPPGAVAAPGAVAPRCATRLLPRRATRPGTRRVCCPGNNG